MMEEEQTVPCELCGEKTYLIATKRCNGCWELESRIIEDKELAIKIMKRLGLWPDTNPNFEE